LLLHVHDLLSARRYHAKALLVTFESDNTAGSHADVLTREVQEGFKRLDGEIRAMGAGDGAGDDDAQVRQIAAGKAWDCDGTCTSSLQQFVVSGPVQDSCREDLAELACPCQFCWVLNGAVQDSRRDDCWLPS
jgi:hypothetical protein